MMNKAGSDLPSSAAAGEEAAWQELKRLLGQRIAEGLAGGLSTDGIASIVDEELGSSHPDT
ncbi:hypothetical protein [Edaphosphingomonas haloaromaticamans]|uniref:hypothetical protein n=1 Tax=Edaphosphingomonas haloaromaticamans TaxID=653954 RepID=UPI0020C75893|nr:hypothetical protein [Sphingomonas haloaromaticamans]